MFGIGFVRRGHTRNGAAKLKKAFIAILLVASLGALLLVADVGGKGSLRKAAVVQLLTAMREADESAMARLLSPNAEFAVHSSFDGQYGPARWLIPDAARCRVAAMSEALGLVAVQMDCPGHEPPDFILDFAFCNQRIAVISLDERGRRLLSPIARELGDRIVRRLNGNPSRCQNSRLGIVRALRPAPLMPRMRDA